MTASGWTSVVVRSRPRVSMRADYQPSESVLKRWRHGTSYETAVGFLVRHVEIDAAGCWVWQYTLNHHGYGVVSHWQSTSHLAHRFAWEVFRGRVPIGLTLDHLCRVRACVNPDHLEPVTMAENLRRSPLLSGRRAAA